MTACDPDVNGKGTFRRIIENIVAAADLIPITVRVNITRNNLAHVEELLAELAGRGLSKRIGVTTGAVMGSGGSAAPIASFDGDLLTKSEYAAVELELMDLAARYGFENPLLPSPRRVFCAVVAPTAVVVGPDGQLWKCWDEVGHDEAVFGSIFELDTPADGLRRWHSYSPFEDAQCRDCIALPVCLGGCPYFAFSGGLRDAQCGTFRFNHQERVDRSPPAAPPGSRSSH